MIAKYEATIAKDQQLYLDADQLADIADWYASERRFDDAQKAISYGLRLHPGNTDLMIEQSYLYLDTQNLQRAKDVAECINEEFEPDVKMLKAELYLNEGKLEEAQQLINSIDDAENDLGTIIEIVNLYLDLGFQEAAKEWLDKGEIPYGHEEDFLAVKAEYLASVQKIKEAIPYFDKLIDLAPFNPAYWMGLAKCYFIIEDVEKAIEACDFALAADEKYGEAYAYKAHCYFYLNNSDAAIENYQKAMELKAIPPELGFMFMGMSYTNKEEWLKANDCFDIVVQKFEEEEDPNSLLLIDTYNSKANVLAKLGEFDEALLMCAKARKINPDEAFIIITEGKIYLEKEMVEEADKIFKKALKASPGVEMLYMIASTYSEYNYVFQAKKYYKKAYKLDPKYGDLPERLSVISIMTNEMDDFLKFNKECSRPFEEESIQRLLSASEHRQEDEPILREILEYLKKEKRKK
nr:tetratricopeptide repeat protein [uncultured Bacteroides sp.]